MNDVGSSFRRTSLILLDTADSVSFSGMDVCCTRIWYNQRRLFAAREQVECSAGSLCCSNAEAEVRILHCLLKSRAT